MNKTNNQQRQQAEKEKRPRKKKLNEVRKVKITNHYANVSEEERLKMGIRIFEILGLLE